MPVAHWTILGSHAILNMDVNTVLIIKTIKKRQSFEKELNTVRE